MLVGKRGISRWSQRYQERKVVMKIKLTENQISINTYWSEDYYKELVRKINDYNLDDKSTTRLSRSECKTCFYLKGNRVVTQAFTEYECGNCESKHIHHNGGVPKYCGKCSDEYQVCVRCGGRL